MMSKLLILLASVLMAAVGVASATDMILSDDDYYVVFNMSNGSPFSADEMGEYGEFTFSMNTAMDTDGYNVCNDRIKSVTVYLAQKLTKFDTTDTVGLWVTIYELPDETTAITYFNKRCDTLDLSQTVDRGVENIPAVMGIWEDFEYYNLFWLLDESTVAWLMYQPSVWNKSEAVTILDAFDNWLQIHRWKEH